MAGPQVAFQRSTAAELSLLSRIRSTSSMSSSTGAALAVIPMKSRLRRVQVVFDGDLAFNWAAKIVTPHGETGPIVGLAEFGGGGAIAAKDALEWHLDPLSDLFYLSRGDVIRLETTTISGSATSAYVAFVLGV